MEKINEAIEYLTAAVQSFESGKKYLDQFSDNEKYNILMTSKKLMAYAAVSKGENMSAKCYDCIHRRNLPGDAHSRCANILATVIGDDHGIKNGWFFHPFNFDPIWLKYCDGYETK